MIKWLNHHVRCPTSLVIKKKKTRKRDKSDLALSSSNLNTTSTHNYNLTTNPVFSTNKPDATQQPTKLKPRKHLNNESRSLNNILNIHAASSSASSFVEPSLAAVVVSHQPDKKAATLPCNKLRSDLDTSLASYSPSTNSRTSQSSSSSISSSSTVNNMIMTSTPPQHQQPSSSSSLAMELMSSPPIVQQPQSIMLTSSSPSSSSSSPFSSPSSNQTPKSTLAPAPPAPTSLSYLDESNLKLAIIDYSDIIKLIKLQNSNEYQEWLAFNTKMYFDQINVVYGAIADHCTLQSCPTMSAPCNQHFHWLDEKGKKFKYSASQYIDTVLTYTAKIISDESLFPTKVGHPFPAHFDTLVKKIHKHLFQILAHMYHAHYKELLQLKLNAYVNSIYLHFLLFNKSFSTLDDKDVEIMDALNKALLNKYVDNSTQQALVLNQQPPTIHQSASSTSSSGFSFFKKKINFNNIMP